MLGIRHCNNVAVDLWQGELVNFVHDAAAKVKISELPSLADFLATHISNAETNKARHLVFDIDTAVTKVANTPQQLFLHLSHFLKKTALQNVRRVTLVLPDLDSYYEFQDALFASMPE